MAQIVGLPLPVQIADGQIADAAQVMGNFNYIASQVNSNAAGATGNFTVIGVFGETGSNLTTATSYVIGGSTPFPSILVNGDIYSEYNSTTGTFTPINGGIYWLSATVNVNINTATVTQAASLAGYVQGVAIQSLGLCNFQGPLPGAFSLSTASITQTCTMLAGQTLQLKTVNNFLFTGGPIQANTFFMNIVRVR